MKFRIGTRGSALALAQTGMVRNTLASRYPEDEFEIVIIKTTGDRNQTASLSGMGTRGVFVKEIEEQLLRGEIDFAVHSMKDMPAEIISGLSLAPCWKREDARDALILREGSTLHPNMVIGTGSLRRSTQLKELCPGIRTVGIRGNIDTRLRKIETEGLDGIVLAAAGLNRLGLQERVTRHLSVEEMIPAPAQGALALEYKTDRADVEALLKANSDAETDIAVQAEREFLALMGGGCFLPVGAYARIENNEIVLRTVFGDAEGKTIVKAVVTADTPTRAAQLAADRIRSCI